MKPFGTRGDGGESGFTMAEMLVVLAIMGLIGLVVSQSASFRRQPSAKDVARDIAGEVRKVALRSLTTAKPQSVRVSVKEGAVYASGPDPLVTVPQEFAVRVTTAAELAETGEAGAILFFPDGASTGGEITILEAENKGYSVNVHWLTGAIETRPVP